MKVLLAGGGTAGHINPAIAIASCIKKMQPDAKILFAGTPNGMESVLIPKAGFDFEPIEVMGIQRSLKPADIKHNIKAVQCLFTAGIRAKKILMAFKPDIVIGTGGYVSGPIVREAAKKGIKTLIHEQNAFPGVTNKILAKKVDAVCLAVGEAGKFFPTTKQIHVTGNPIRESIIYTSKEQARKQLGLDDSICILSFGGSLGSATINKIVADMMQWHHKKGDINHIHAYGKHGKGLFPKMLKERGVDAEKNPRLDVREYIHDMDSCLAAADLVICRAGAITVSELEATGKASILIPAPFVAENHQFHNAMVLQRKNAAIVIEDKNYNKEEFIDIINSFYIDKQKLIEYGKNAQALAIYDTADRIYSIMMKLLE